jgi:alkanesulfonate monooxygenase SsuD/methylene tetrahydromethanopterin reductase-like flavin-dependent oxidoreductase (luciferase family)
VCDAVEGRFLQAADVSQLRSACLQAQANGADVVLLVDGPLGDAVVLAASLSVGTSVLLGVCTSLSGDPHRHPTVLAREMTTLDHLCDGRAMVVFAPPHDEAVMEAIRLCRDMWRLGTATSDGPFYPVPGAVNRPAPSHEGSPRIALDLTGGDSQPAAALLALVDFILMPTGDPTVCLVLPA